MDMCDQGVRPLNVFAHLEVDEGGLACPSAGSLPFLIIDAARLGRHQVVHCGAEGCRTSTEEKDRKDERSF